MKLPKKLKAFGRNYDIISDDEVTSRYDSYGLMHPGQEAVFLQKRCGHFSEEKEASTFLHEVLHIIDENLRIGIKEKQINLLAVGLYQVIVDNKINFMNESTK